LSLFYKYSDNLDVIATLSYYNVIFIQ